MDRRDFLKVAGAAGLGIGAVASGISGHADGADPMTRTGWANESKGVDGVFNHRPFEVDRMTSRVLGPTKRISIFDSTWNRRLSTNFAYALGVPEGGAGLEAWLRANVNVNDPESVPFDIVQHEGLRNYYINLYRRNGWNALADDIRRFTDIEEFFRATNSNPNTWFDTHLIRTYTNAWAIHAPTNMGWVRTRGTEPRATNSDYILVNGQHLDNITTYPTVSAEENTRLIKQMAIMYGSHTVRIVRLNNDFAYTHHPGPQPIAIGSDVNIGSGRGYDRWEPLEIPDHWVYGIIFGQTHEWDTVMANPLWGLSFDAYVQCSITAARLAEFIKRLGFPAREQSPNSGYEYVIPPLMVAAGMGELGRSGMVITPESGSNIRPAMVITNMPLIPDKPIDMNIMRFCRHCKICAEVCPSGSISFDDEPKNMYDRGYEGWEVNLSSCNNQMRRTAAQHIGCRLCISVCPFSQKQNTLHRFARDLVARDPTGLSDRLLTWMEGAFYGKHNPLDYIYEQGSRRYASPRPQPWFLNSSTFLRQV